MQSVAQQLSAGRVVAPAAEEPLPLPLLETSTAAAAVGGVTDLGVVGPPAPPPSSSSSSSEASVRPCLKTPLKKNTFFFTRNMFFFAQNV